MSQTPDHLASSDLDGALLLGDHPTPPTRPSVQEVPISLKRLVAGGFRARRMITFCVLIGGLGAAGAAVMEPNTYVSRAAVLVQSGHEGIQVDEMLPNDRSVGALIGNAPHILLSPEVAANVVDRIGPRTIQKPYEPPEESVGLMAPIRNAIYDLQRKVHHMEDWQFTTEGAQATLLDNLSISTPEGGSSVLYVEYSAYDARDAQDILNVILEEAKKKHAEVYGDEDLIDISAAVNREAQRRYDEAQEAYDAFLEKIGVIDFDLEHEARESAVQDARQAYEDLVAQETEYRTRREFLQKQLEDVDRVIETEVLEQEEDPLIQSLIGSIQATNTQLTQAVTARGENDPTVKRLRLLLSDYESQLEKARSNPKPPGSRMEQAVNPQFEEIQRQLNSLAVELAVTEGGIEPARLKIAPAEEKLEDLTRHASEERNLQRLVDKALEQLNASGENIIIAEHKQDLKGKALSSIRLLNRPSLPLQRAGPNRGKTTAIGLVVGLMIGLGFSFLRTVLDGTIRSTDDLEQMGDVPVLATVPRMTRRNLQRHRKARLSGC